MGRFLRLYLSNSHCKTSRCALALTWCGGLLFGVFISLSADHILTSTMRAALFSNMSIFGLLAVILLPLFLSAIAVSAAQPLFLLSIISLKAFLIAFTGIGVLTTFDSAGWLICCLMMFSDMLSVPILWWFWLRVVDAKHCHVLKYTVTSAFLAVLIGLFDFFFIVPFLANLISFQKG